MTSKNNGGIGLLITLEGGEGAGKSTLLNQLAGALEREGYHVVKTREPGGSKLSEFIRQWLLNRDFSISVGQKAELLLFLAARAQHIEELILPALKKGSIVLCDRFNDSTVAYQGFARGLGADFVKGLCQSVCGEVKPALTLFLDLDPTIGLHRTKRIVKENAGKDEADRIEAESLEFHQKVREAFQTLAKQEHSRFVTIDASKPQEDVYKASWHAIQHILQRML